VTIRSLGLRVDDELANVPAEGVHHLCGAIRLSNALRLVADAAEIAAEGRLIGCAPIIVPKLDQDGVSRLHLREKLVPQTFLTVGSGASACSRAVVNVDFARIEVGGKWIAPA
jgi:hypothetical protein